MCPKGVDRRNASRNKSGRVAGSISFECRDCRKPATVVERDGTVECVYCPACGSAVDAGAAVQMHQTLLGRYRRRLERIASGRSGRWHSNRFADRRWPFVMIVAE